MPSFNDNVQTGNRFYISLNKSFNSNTNIKLPSNFKDISKSINNLRLIRSLGWILVPPYSDSQYFHQDYNYDETFHFLWNKSKITTEFIEKNFNNFKKDTEQISIIDTNSLIFKSNLLHRGNSNKTNEWKTCFSIEILTQNDYENWCNDNGFYKNNEDWVHIKCSF